MRPKHAGGRSPSPNSSESTNTASLSWRWKLQACAANSLGSVPLLSVARSSAILSFAESRFRGRVSAGQSAVWGNEAASFFFFSRLSPPQLRGGPGTRVLETVFSEASFLTCTLWKAGPSVDISTSKGRARPPERLGLWHERGGGEKRRPLTRSGFRPLHRSQPGGSGRCKKLGVGCFLAAPGLKKGDGNRKRGPIPKREAGCNDLDATVIKARDRHIEVTDKGVRGHSSPGLAAHALPRAASTPECTRPGSRRASPDRAPGSVGCALKGPPVFQACPGPPAPVGVVALFTLLATTAQYARGVGTEGIPCGQVKPGRSKRVTKARLGGWGDGLAGSKPLTTSAAKRGSWRCSMGRVSAHEAQ